jgi:hypothetical protein
VFQEGLLLHGDSRLKLKTKTVEKCLTDNIPNVFRRGELDITFTLFKME